MLSVTELLLVTDEWLSIEHGWTDTDGKNFQRNLSECSFVHHKSQLDWPEFELGSLWWEAGNKLPEALYGHTVVVWDMKL
jgi:hypothetical protein